MAQAVVTTFVGLRTAAQDPTIDYIYVNADIMIETGGILLPKDKPSLVIDCRYPDDDETGVIHSITDIISNAHSNSIRIAATAGSYHLTLKNCVFVGRNYYGAISCINSTLQNTTVLTLDNVTYSGPQAAYNRYGSVEVIGGDYRIGNYNGTTAAVNEFLETNRVIMRGNTNVFHDGSPNSCFYISEANPKFTLTENAVLNVEVRQRELIYNDVVGMDFVMENNSKLYATCAWSMFYSASMRANFMTIGDGAELVFDQRSARLSVPTFNLNGNLTVGQNSRLIIIKRYFTSTDALIQFSTTSTAQFNDPLSVVLYNPNGRTFNWSGGTGTLAINSQILNYWTNAATFPAAGTFVDIPLYNWTKADGSNTSTTATIYGNNTTAVTTNLIVGVDAPVIPNTSSFNVQNARVLAFGKLNLDVIDPKKRDLSVKGLTRGEALVRANVNDGAYFNSQADGTGDFSIAISPELNKNDLVKVGANIDFLIVEKQYYAKGTIFMTVPNTLPFVRVAVPIRRAIFQRENADWALLVNDSRDNGTDWSVYARATVPMTNGSGSTLDDALIFNDNGTIYDLETPLRVKIYDGVANTDPDYTETEIKWSAIYGFLMRLIPDYLYEAGFYEGNIEFLLEE